MLGGLKVVENNSLVVEGKPIQVPRTLWERLFTLPWRPFKKTTTVIPMEPDPMVYQVGDSLHMHPLVANQLKKESELHDGRFL